MRFVPRLGTINKHDKTGGMGLVTTAEAPGAVGGLPGVGGRVRPGAAGGGARLAPSGPSTDQPGGQSGSGGMDTPGRLLVPGHHHRHTFCTRLCEQETNLKVIQSGMGHKDIKTTMDIYAEATEEKKQESFERLAATWNVF